MAEELSERTYGLREAAARLGVSARSVRRWVLSRQLEAHLAHGLYGQEYRITETALDAYAATMARVSVASASPGAESTVAKRLSKSGAAIAMALETLSARQAADAAALERAWARVAELERELATAQARLSAPVPEARPLSWRERLSGRARTGDA